MNAALLTMLLFLGAPGDSSASADLCRCIDNQRTMQVTATLSQAGVKGDLDTALAQAERQAALRGAFALVFCGTSAEGFERIDGKTVEWKGHGCRAGNPSPRVWPELFRIECPSKGEWPALPEAFQVSGEPWQSRGEELNRVWSKLVRVSSSCQN